MRVARGCRRGEQFGAADRVRGWSRRRTLRPAVQAAAPAAPIVMIRPDIMPRHWCPEGPPEHRILRKELQDRLLHGPADPCRPSISEPLYAPRHHGQGPDDRR